MEDLKQAYATLGLPENATKEEVEKRYYLLMRQARAQGARRDHEEAGGNAVDFEAVNRAYKFIIEYDERKAQEQFKQSQYGKYKKMAGTAEKLDHFFHYYKFHLLGALVAVILIGFAVNSYLERQAQKAEEAKKPPIDVSVMFHGDFYLNNQNQDTEELEAALLSFFPEWKRIGAQITYDPSDPKNEFDIAATQKAVVMLMTEKSDVYILDRNSFTKLARQQLFQPLDEAYEQTLKPLLPSEAAALKTRSSEDTTDHIYGIDISGSPLVKSIPVVSKEMIAAIRADAKHPDKALLFIQRMLEGTKPEGTKPEGTKPEGTSS